MNKYPLWWDTIVIRDVLFALPEVYMGRDDLTHRATIFKRFSFIFGDYNIIMLFLPHIFSHKVVPYVLPYKFLSFFFFYNFDSTFI